ncbi:MAG: orotidine 5'-phosphate decarboxylase [Deltaproteobacteria bacterium 13_1_20CM_2_69_21]|nr:MAG: orotidine 5'-phosphate decarboxylase [Deltaproteobacteria bacterium 13_1_40CM_68_24]OLC77150.1 MAG: orotidine 5'-phosphate decarboxylase [Deltaproteobacteria bacterium 13_1_40CM_4_68_19]OLD08520.1 MAG: orotidine 5'-phosphate decarboxylase [Deltaproteobacteria bacterium 13_1_40CM_3_69_14]OLD46925.1 MAG: orotidine 5'-phosphate decarboxylase [Chloroflexi bacterium 13_1_40CM_2_68_14]OLE64054.1 MAG: orotidine 5'-phosphate decarboxylase [Deltaproteobacteria bacterium 13_1_20CM_2_69_21]HMC339
MNPICAALDVKDPAAAERLASRLAGHVGLFKVGLELFLAHGRASVDAIRKFGLPIFLDLKLHDIPQTVERAARGVAELGVDYLTVHASGGSEMIRAARRALPRTKLLAVTALTSLGPDDLDAVGLARDAVPRLARLAVAAGADGVVCAPQEVSALRASLGPGLLLVVPGIRPAGAAPGDQRRTGTPAEAIRAGASILVIGRPLRDASDPAAAADAIAREIAG